MWGVRNERLTNLPRKRRGGELARRRIPVVSGMRDSCPMIAMPPLDEAQLAQLRAALAARLAALAGVAEPLAVGGGRDLPVSEIETSPADKATVRLLNDLALEAAGHNAAQMQVLRHALAKFDDGGYGLCEECAGDIGFSRLQARPEARLCITCQTRLEKR